MLNFKVIAAALALVSLSGSLFGCAQLPKKELVVDETPLIKSDYYQGWKPIEKAPPAVGEFDVIYNDTTATQNTSDTFNASNNCAYADGPDRSVLVCEKGARERRLPMTRESI